MKVIDLTGSLPILGETKESWLFKCSSCGYQAIFILWSGSGMSTACELCKGDIERIRKLEKEGK